jgi:zinc protease
MDGGSAGLVEAVTTEDIARVVRRLLDPARLTFVVVGRSEGLEPTH